jgi:hypothetical protein
MDRIIAVHPGTILPSNSPDIRRNREQFITNMIRIQRVLLTVASAVLMSVPALAGVEVSRYKVKDESVRVEYSWVEGCVSYQLEVKAGRTRVKEDGTPEVTPAASINYSTSDFCNLPELKQEFWFGESTSFQIDISGNIRYGRFFTNSFTLNELVPDGSGGVVNGRSMNLFVDMVWTSEDPLERLTDTVVTHHPGYHSISLLTGLYRNAVVAGTLSDGSRNLIPLGPGFSFAQILRLNTSEMTIIKD